MRYYKNIDIQARYEAYEDAKRARRRSLADRQKAVIDHMDSRNYGPFNGDAYDIWPHLKRDVVTGPEPFEDDIPY